MRNRLISKWLASGAGALTVALAMAPGIAAAQDRATDPSTLDILSVLVEKGVLTRQDADVVLGEARKRAETREAVVRVPYVPEALREQITQEVRQEVLKTAKAEGWAQPGALPGWLDRISFSGDIRVRGEGMLFQQGNAPTVLDVNAINADGGFNRLEVLPFRDTIDDRFRARVRTRFGAEMAINRYVDAAIRFATGDIRDGNSTNATLTQNFGHYQVGFDRAFIRVRPFAEDSMFAGTGVTFGKFDNPFVSTEAVFDRDLQFEGAALKLAARFGSGEGAPNLFLTAGAFPLEEYEFTQKDKYLLAGQIGAGVSPVAGIRLQAAASYYHYNGLQGRYNTPGLRDNDFTAPTRVQFGNSIFNLRNDGTAINTVLFGLASDFSVASVYARAEFDINPTMSASIEFEGARNLAFDDKDLIARAVPSSSGDTLLHARVRVGHRDLDPQGAWQMNAGYRRLEGDSVPDLFTDSDFGLGGTDQKGFVVGASWAPFDRVTLSGTWYSARTIDLIAPTGLPAAPVDTDTVHVDLAVKF
jgi:hypothetical protein